MAARMKVAFAGTPEFAREALAAILAAGFDVPLVLTQPNRPAGRGMKLQASPVKQLAQQHGITVSQPHSLRLDGKYPEEAAAARDALLAAAPDVMVVAAYGLILPQWTLDLPRLGCLNIHGSLLPRWRGAAPIHRAIEAGDAETGITIMQMDEGLDTGAMLRRAALPILDTDTTGSLHDKLAELGAREIVALLPELAAGRVEATPQNDALANYAAKIGKDDARLEWTRPARELDRKIRAFNPFPGAHGLFSGQPLKIWRAALATDSGPPGSLLKVDRQALRVACGEGALDILEVQLAGGKRLAVDAFLAGHSLRVGDRLE